MTIQLVSRPNVQELFPLMEAGLKRPLTKTTLGLYWDLQSLFDHIVNLQAYGFYQHESQYSGAFTITVTPLRRCLNIFWAGKDLTNKVPIDEVECDAFFKACAKYFECDVIVVRGRKGWQKAGERLGYLEDSRSYIKEV